jgi:hypothetical protein
MVNCQEHECESKASYGFKFAEPIYCMTHGKLYKAKTQYQVCRCGLSTPRFQLLDDERASCCSKCKTDKMVNTVERRCKCEKHLPTYGKETDKRPEYCSECKKEGMINLKDKNKRCECKKAIPSFGNPGDKKATCCASCKKEGMINLILDLCPCGKSAAFGFKGDKTPSYCNKCKKEGMENIVTKKCKCGKAVPAFGKETDKKATCCISCKTKDMINISSKKCNCGKSQPTFGLKTDVSPSCCVSCKEKDMVDIRSKKCHCGKAQPVFGLETDNKATHCASCKTEGMINIKAKMCECGKSQPFFGIPGSKEAKHCFSCKKDNMVDIKSSNCPSRYCKGTHELQAQGLKCPFGQVGKIKYDYYCTLCFQENFPTDPRTKFIRQKTKEMIVKEFLLTQYKEIPFIHDRALWTGQADCTCRRRIDFRALYGNTLLCIEVDEEQHKYKNKEDEAIRYDDLFMLHGGKFIFIRFNPDSYIDKNGQRQTTSIESRLFKLYASINKQIERIKEEKNSELVEVEYLYFDEK